MFSAATAVAEFLQTEGFGEIGKDIFISAYTPLTPDNIIVVIDSGTGSPDSPTEHYTYPLVQIITRGIRGGYQDNWILADRIRRYLNGFAEKIDDSRFIYMFVESGPIDIGYDDVNRPQCSINIRTMRTEFYHGLFNNTIQQSLVSADITRELSYGN